MCFSSTSSITQQEEDTLVHIMKKYQLFAVGLVAVVVFAPEISSYHCDRTPSRAAKPQNTIDTNRYVIEISGNAKNYVPGENYTISLRSNPSMPFSHRFLEFTVVVESVNPLDMSASTGSFHLIDQLTKFSIRCRNTVIQTNTLAKTAITVAWIAPPPKSGCVAIKATVFESSDNWFSDTGELTKTLCEEDSENDDVQSPALKRCCACEEAKYEMAFQGLWSRNTHPKDFPTDVWTTKFSDIVGASHKTYKSFWSYNGVASDGLRLLAEEGNSSLLESELKEMVKSEDIRTIIKARELSYPNITGTSYTVFRVDNENHVISVVSKITPSPDWFVGVANLELCTRNCSWVESKTFNLYPWDVGTDDGLSYTSADLPSRPPQPIRKIKSNSPNKEESPFFNEEGEPIKPLARLHLTRQKLYEKTCSSADNNDEDNEEIDPNCATTEWTEWSACSNACQRFKQRSYVTPEVSDHCGKTLVLSEPCTGPRHCQPESNSIEVDSSKCELTNWSNWSSCSVPCGEGVRTQDRTYVNSVYESSCSLNGEELQRTEECTGASDNCRDFVQPKKEECPNTDWGEWTPCSVTCGTGTKQRQRQSINDADEEVTCDDFMQTVECYNADCEEAGRAFGNMATDNQVSDPVLLTEGPDGPVIDCKVSKWSIWSPCNNTIPCKNRHKYKERHIIIHAQNGGKACPKKLKKEKQCRCDKKHKRKDNDSRETQPTWGPSGPLDKISIDCVMDEWTAWTPCNRNCGSSGVQIRTRGIKVKASGDGKECEERVETKKCPSTLPCDSRGFYN